MKKNIFIALACAITSSLLFNSCKKSDAVTAPATPDNAISSDPSLSIFTAMINKSGDGTLINSGSTILAPTDSAFINAGITAASVANLSAAACDSIVRYYTLAAGIQFNGTTNTETSFTTTLGAPVFADSTGTQLYFDGSAAVSATPVVSGAASIYKLSQIIIIPSTSVAQIAGADTSLSLFNEAFNRTSLAAHLTGGNYTVFMPTNTAFANAGYPDIASIDAADINTLTQLLLYHTLSNSYFDNDLAQQTALTTLQGGNIQVVTANGKLQLAGNSNAATPASFLTNGELAGSNIETYKIDTVLMP
ncbi:MAG: fasciclin domain-containing protein [Bacteroidetes bacterium]|nr:fasciclin domain-containing protein [Bacteroidota bacterium]